MFLFKPEFPSHFPYKIYFCRGNILTPPRTNVQWNVLYKVPVVATCEGYSLFLFLPINTVLDWISWEM